MNKEDGK